MNRAAGTIVGVEPETLLGTKVWTVNPSESNSPIAKALERARTTKRVVDFEEYFSPAGRWLSGHIFPSPEGVTVIFSDATQRHANEQSVRMLLDQLRRQRRLATVLAETNEVVFRATTRQQLFDAATRIVVELGGFLMCWIGELDNSSGDVHPLAWAGVGAREYLGQHQVSARVDATGQGIAGQALRSGVARYSNDVRSDDSMAPWREFAARVGYRSLGGIPLVINGVVRGAMLVYAAEPDYFNEEERDLLQRLVDNVAHGWEALENEEALRRVREESERTARLEDLGLLASGVAHDFNNLLGVILNYTTLLERRVDDATVVEDLSAIRVAAERGGALTRQLLTFARREPTTPITIDVNKSLANVVKLLEPVIGVSVEVVLEFDPSTPPVTIDPQQLDQVVLNLALNARDAMPHGGRLTISSHGHPDSTAEIVIADTGVGMSDEVARRAFEPFFTTKPREHGTGLGLATVYGIIQRAGGRINLTSTPGLGTRVHLRFPAASSSPAPPSIDIDDVFEGRGELVLVVDDDDALRQSTTRLLEEAGYRVATATDGLEALEVLHRPDSSINVVLSDRTMPRMGGDQLKERIRETHPHVPVVLMTGLGDTLAESSVVLFKPFSESALLQVVREALHGT